MVAKCANHSCVAKFLYLHEGALFSVESGSGVATLGLLNAFHHAGKYRRFQYFWLCPRCYQTMTLRVEGEQVIAVQRKRKPSSITSTEADSAQAA
jgi:hypothetical protein